MDIPIQNLPAYEQITNSVISEAVAAFSAAEAALDESVKTHVQAELELPASQLKDAEADERARHEGKEPPKVRKHTQEHERRIADLAHERLVRGLAVDRAQNELVAALDEHGDAWAAEVAESVEAMVGQWQAVTGELIELHGRLMGALRVARVVGIKAPQVAALEFERRAIENVEFASPQPPAPAFVQTATVLAALAGAVAVPEPEPTEAVQHPPLRTGNSAVRGHAGVQREIDERREFTERASSPDRVEERRRRTEAMRAGREAAIAEQAAS